MEQTSPIYLSKEDFLSIQKRKIGYGKDGVTFRYNRQEIIKIYHQNLDSIMLSLAAFEKDSVKIYEKGNYDERLPDVLTAYIYNEENDERLKLPSKNAIKLAIEKQKRITKTRLPKNLVYVEKIFAGCLIDYQKGIQIHKLKGLPFSLKRQITLEILKNVRELIENNIYHVDLDNSPYSSKSVFIHSNGSKELVGHSHILVDYRLHPHLIDLEGKSTIYTERKDEIYEQECLFRLMNLIFDFLFDIDIDGLYNIDFEKEALEFELEKAGVDDKHIAIVSEYNSSIDEIEDFVKTLNIRRSL